MRAAWDSNRTGGRFPGSEWVDHQNGGKSGEPRSRAIWTGRQAGRTGVSYSDHYEEKVVFARLMDRLRRIAPRCEGYAPVMVPVLR